MLCTAPPPSTQPYTRHTLNCLVQNETGVLARVSSVLAARGFNIDSLIVCATEISDLSRMCIVLRGQDNVIEQARRQLEDLVRTDFFFSPSSSVSWLTRDGLCVGTRMGGSRLYANQVY